LYLLLMWFPMISNPYLQASYTVISTMFCKT
jgi:hypothetical protein